MVFLWIYLSVLLISTLTWFGLGIKYIKYFKTYAKEHINYPDMDDLAQHMHTVLEHVSTEGLINSYEDYINSYQTCSKSSIGSFVFVYIMGFVVWPCSWIVLFCAFGLNYIVDKINILIRNWVKR